MRRLLLAALVLLMPVVVLAQAKAPSIEGVWQISSVVSTGANALNNPKAQPSLIIFTRTHYSWISVNGTDARPNAPAPKDPNKPTNAEKLAAFAMWDPLTAQSGTYQFTGTMLTRRPTVAKNVAVMTTNPPIVAQARLEGNKLTLIAKSATGQPASETTTVLTRVE
jgi:hypothetical protein